MTAETYSLRLEDLCVLDGETSFRHLVDDLLELERKVTKRWGRDRCTHARSFSHDIVG